MSERLALYSYWRSSAAYRVRIGLKLKRLPYDIVPVHLVRNGGEQLAPEYAEHAPQKLVPMLVHGQRRMRQSLSILEYLDEVWPEPPLLPSTARGRQRVRELAQLVACEIHPLNNLRVMRFLEHEWNVPQPEREVWLKHWMVEGLGAFEALLEAHPSTDAFCDGTTPGLADCCLVPQLYNARRFGVDLSPFPTLLRIEQACLALPAFDAARPEKQPDAP